jgi:hypothetical protein
MMRSQLATQLDTTSRPSRRAAHRSRRALVVSALGPLTALVGLVWAVVQPHRITLLHPGDHGFWALAVEPPLLVILVGVLFHLLVAPGMLEDLEAEQR